MGNKGKNELRRLLKPSEYVSLRPVTIRRGGWRAALEGSQDGVLQEAFGKSMRSAFDLLRDKIAKARAR